MPRSLTTRTARTRGFTLIELMVTMAIVGILAAIAYPMYGKYVIKSNRAAAQVHLIELAQAQTQYMADSRSYAGSVTDLGLTTPAIVSAKYRIKFELKDGPPSSFKITAEALSGPQFADGNLSIDSAGTRLPDGKW
jgi:type IV pilus assembly protein PilE